MKWLRYLIIGLIFSFGEGWLGTGFVASPQQPILPEREIAGEWIKAFDGKTTSGWKIEGEAKVGGGGGVAACSDDHHRDWSFRAQATAPALQITVQYGLSASRQLSSMSGME